MNFNKLLITTASVTLSSALTMPVTIAQDSNSGVQRLEEIVVTAQRREQNLQDVPVSVTSLSANDLANRQIRDVNDLASQLPNTVIVTGGGTSSAARVFLRGVGEDESRGAIDPAVGIYVDGIYLGRTVGSLVDLVDIERVEVLRGPQGTLYGRNTNGGAIKLVSIAPQFENTFDIEAGFGSDARANLRGSANFQLSDQTALRLTSLYKSRDGFFSVTPNGDLANLADNNVGEEEVFAFRGSILHKFDDSWSALLSVDMTNDDTEPAPSSIIDSSSNPALPTDIDQNIFTVEPAQGVTCSSLFPAVFQPLGCFVDFQSEVETLGVSLKVDGQIGTFDFTSLSGFRDMEDDLSSHIGSPFAQQTDQDQFSQEFTIASTYEGPFNFLAGVYYFTESVELDSVFFAPFSVSVETDSYAAFFQSTYSLTETLNLTTGVRFTNEERDFIGESGAQGFGLTLPQPVVDSADTSEVTYTAKLDQKLTENVLLYGSYTTGFKSPGFSPDCFGNVSCFLPVEQESLDSFEIGIRSDLLDDSLRLNVTYFFNDYEDLQVSATVPGVGFTRSNAGSADIQGIEIESSWYPTNGLQIFGNASWLDAEYTDVSLAQAGTLTNGGASCPGGVATIECALGLDLKNAPEFKLTIGFLASVPMANGTLTLGGDAAYEDDTFGQLSNPAGAEISPGTRVNAQIGYEPDNANWRVSLWGKNLTDEEYFASGLAPTAAGRTDVYPAAPFTWGIDVGLSF